MVVLVGSSSTGKTRACWEAVQPLAELGWRLWHPFDPTRAEAALDDLRLVQPRTVVWLNEAQHYLGDAQLGERIAAAVHALLTDPARVPVLVLGTLWPEYARRYTALPDADRPDPHSRVRELLAAGHILLHIPDSFDAQALHAAGVLAKGGDQLLADALTRASGSGQVTQDLAGARELLHAYQHGSPAARALLEAAMDARRLGVGLHLPHTFLTHAATDYLKDTDYHDLTDDWAESAFAELAHRVHGRQAPLRRAHSRPVARPPGTPPSNTQPGPPAGPVFRLADYLEQHARTNRWHLCPPASFWHAAHTHLTNPDDLNSLTKAATARCRLQWAHHLLHRAADAGSAEALIELAKRKEDAGGRDSASALLHRAADAGSAEALIELAEREEDAGDQDGAQALLHRAADAGSADALIRLADMRKNAGDQDGAQALLHRAADTGHTHALIELAEREEDAGDQDGAQALLHRAADAGSADALIRLADMRKNAGDQDGAEALLHRAADTGHAHALSGYVVGRIMSGWEGVGALLWRAADAGHTYALIRLADMRKNAGYGEGAEALLRQAADAGHTYALRRLAEMRVEANDPEGAEAVLRQAADAGDVDALFVLATMRERAGDDESAKALLHQAADAGLDSWPRTFRWHWPFGLDPDGNPTAPWHPSTPR
ncbi:tetratricopeptide repeat protein [Streptomyces niveus]|uniref:tetratricopeptide repeat protein n=1 Tax=Streptomyces niveus TaxID=193462 RepID=UPI0036D3BE79